MNINEQAAHATQHSTPNPALTGKRAHVVFTCAVAALAGLLFGLDIGVISGALPFIAATFGVNDATQEIIVSAMMVGAALGALAAGWLASRFGRKYSLVCAAGLFIAGSLYCAYAWNPAALIGGRFVLGLAVGVASFTAPLYLSEIAPPAMRGAMISLHQLMVTVGILAAFVSDTFFSYSSNWRGMLGVIAIPALALLLGVLSLPRSPRWLMRQGREREARQVLGKLRADAAAVDTEITEIAAQLRVRHDGFSLFRGNHNFRRSVFLGALLQIMQQLTGINVVMYYAPRIYGLAGYTSHHDQLWGTVMVGAINVAATVAAIGLVDRWGRKPILYAGFAVMGVGMGVLGTLLHMGISTPFERAAAVAMLLIFIAGFAVSAGPLIWVLCAEIQPIKGRDFGIAVSTFVNWLTNTLAGATFLTLLNRLGGAHTFWLYAGFNLAFLLCVACFVPETKAISLERIERNLMDGKPLRRLGQ